MTEAGSSEPPVPEQPLPAAPRRFPAELRAAVALFICGGLTIGAAFSEMCTIVVTVIRHQPITFVHTAFSTRTEMEGADSGYSLPSYLWAPLFGIAAAAVLFGMGLLLSTGRLSRWKHQLRLVAATTAGLVVSSVAFIAVEIISDAAEYTTVPDHTTPVPEVDTTIGPGMLMLVAAAVAAILSLVALAKQPLPHEDEAEDADETSVVVHQIAPDAPSR